MSSAAPATACADPLADPLSGCGEEYTEPTATILLATNAGAVDEDGDGEPAPLDCDDMAATVRPGATDSPCNGIDEDCDGLDLCFGDLDGDGVPDPLDCDDVDAEVFPAAQEVPCNDDDEDCDGVDWCDADLDGSPAYLDCNDTDTDVHPRGIDLPCDGVDQDCSGVDCCGQDLDGDGADCATDCDELDASRHPGAGDACDGIDQNCDGVDGVAGSAPCRLM